MYNFGNPYYQPYMPQQRIQQPMEQNNFNPFIQNQQSYQQNPQSYPQQVLQGKSVESIDVVKAIDMPLDGSINYYPLVDGSAIVTKQLQQDGTSKVVIYKPQEEKAQETPKYITEERLNEILSKEDTNNYEEEIKGLKRQIRDLQEDIKEIQKSKTRKSDN